MRVTIVTKGVSSNGVLFTEQNLQQIASKINSAYENGNPIASHDGHPTTTNQASPVFGHFSDAKIETIQNNGQSKQVVTAQFDMVEQNASHPPDRYKTFETYVSMGAGVNNGGFSTNLVSTENGAITSNSDGIQVINGDFNLTSIDLVQNPATTKGIQCNTQPITHSEPLNLLNYQTANYTTKNFNILGGGVLELQCDATGKVMQNSTAGWKQNPDNKNLDGYHVSIGGETVNILNSQVVSFKKSNEMLPEIMAHNQALHIRVQQLENRFNQLLADTQTLTNSVNDASSNIQKLQNNVDESIANISEQKLDATPPIQVQKTEKFSFQRLV